MSEPYATVLPYTMVGMRRLKTLRSLVERLNEEGIEGDIVECGTCNGGSGALLAHAAMEDNPERHTWLLDSFEGLPQPGDKDGSSAQVWTGFCRGSQGAVREVLAELDVPASKVSIVPGWFEDTLPQLDVEAISLLHVDADWYQSVLDVLNSLYDRVEPGGFIVFDDYGYWEGCAKAWEDFSTKRGIDITPVDIDGTGAYVRVRSTTRG